MFCYNHELLKPGKFCHGSSIFSSENQEGEEKYNWQLLSKECCTWASNVFVWNLLIKVNSNTIQSKISLDNFIDWVWILKGVFVGFFAKDNRWIDFFSTIISKLTLLSYLFKTINQFWQCFSQRSQRNFGINLRFVVRYICDRMCSGWVTISSMATWHDNHYTIFTMTLT